MLKNLIAQGKPKYRKRDCGIKIRLVPYGSGWIDVHMDIGFDSHYFVLSYQEGDPFYALLRALYYLHPNHNDPQRWDEGVDIWRGICERDGDEYKVVRIVPEVPLEDLPCVVRQIPWKTEFIWNAEREAICKWTLERIPTEDPDFMLKITIDNQQSEPKCHTYEVRYKDLCYAVAKTCTEVLKSHGIYGYHYSVYEEDMHLRYLLFVKAVALDNLESRELTKNERRNGYSTSLEKELELLLFDM